MKKRMMAMAAAVMSAALLAGCGGTSTPESGASSAGAQATETPETSAGGATAESVAARVEAAEGALDKLGNIDDIRDAEVTIGCSWMNLTTEYAANLQKLLDAYVERDYPNVTLVHMDAASDASNQCSQVENLISQGVDAILMDPFDRNGCAPATEACAEAGIPMIELCQETTATEERTSFVGSIHYESGDLLMEALAEKTGGAGKVVFLEGPIGQDSALDRTTAGKDVMEKYPDMELVTERVCDWDRAAAMTAVENIIQSGMEFDVIYAESDTMALGAMEAIKGTDLEGKVIVGGIDMIADALDSIKKGEMYCTAFQNAPLQAEYGLEVAVRAALGEKVEKDYIIPFEIVTAENASEYENVLDIIK